MGLLTAAVWLPWLVSGLPAGVWVDRLPPRIVMIAADVVSAAALLTVPVFWLLGALTLAHLLILALVGGTVAVFFRTAYIKLLPLVVPDPQLESANARLFGTEPATQIAGPGLGGFIVQWLSAPLGILIDAVSFLVSALCLALIRPRPSTPSAVPDRRIVDGGANTRRNPLCHQRPVPACVDPDRRRFQLRPDWICHHARVVFRQ